MRHFLVHGVHRDQLFQSNLNTISLVRFTAEMPHYSSWYHNCVNESLSTKFTTILVLIIFFLLERRTSAVQIGTFGWEKCPAQLPSTGVNCALARIVRWSSAARA